MNFKQIIFEVLQFLNLYHNSGHLDSLNTSQLRLEKSPLSCLSLGGSISLSTTSLKLQQLLDDSTSALDVSCLIMSNKLLVRFVAWIEM